MPLAVADGQAPLITGHLTVAVVNPYSANRDIAVALIEEALSALSAKFLADTSSARNEAVRAEDYAQTRERQTENLEMTRAVLNSATDEERPMWW